MQCSSNIKQLGLAMSNYESQHGYLPIGIVLTSRNEEDPQPLHTAQAQLLSFIAPELPYNFSKGLANNRPSTAAVIPALTCPTDPNSGNAPKTRCFFSRSNYVVCFGSEMMVKDSAGKNIFTEGIESADISTDGAFQANIARTLGQLVDGTSNTVVAGELLAGPDDEGDRFQSDTRGMWGLFNMGAFSYTHFNPPNTSVADSTYCPEGPEGNVCYCHDYPPYLPCDNSARADASQFQAAARSHHTDGVNVVFADGHVSLVSNTVDMTIWRALSTIKGGEIVPDTY